MSNEYVAGVCNIGKKEIRKRYIVGILGAFVSIHLSLYFIISPYKWWMLIALLIPTFYSTLNLFQAASKFCVKFAYNKLFNFGELDTEKKQVTDLDAISKDQTKMKRILIYSFLIALAWVILIYTISPKAI